MPHVDKAVGIPTKYSDEQKNLETYISNKFKEGGKKIEEHEIEKTERDIFLIDFTQKAVDDYLKKYSRKKNVIIPIENVHILEKGGVSKFTGGKINTGACSPKYGDIVVDRTEIDIDFSLVVFHELMHLKSYNSLQVTNGKTKEERTIQSFRGGFSVTTRDGKKTFFKDVNEAIVGFLTKKFFEEYIEKSDIFKDELTSQKEKKISFNLSRQKEMRDGMKYMSDIYELNKNKYSQEEIMDIFIDAGINGNLLKVARLIEETFGKGSFRILGEATAA